MYTYKTHIYTLSIYYYIKNLFCFLLNKQSSLKRSLSTVTVALCVDVWTQN